jgi:protein-tyrosine phosphatase
VVDISFVADHLWIASKFYPPDHDLPPRAVIIDLEPWFADGPLQGDEPLGQLRSLAQAERAKKNNVVLQCKAGRNRSALIAAMCLIEDGLPPQEAIAQVRASRTTLATRGGALTNDSFVDFLLRP